jgi:fibronectin type 3 domain-containing protein
MSQDLVLLNGGNVGNVTTFKDTDPALNPATGYWYDCAGINATGTGVPCAPAHAYTTLAAPVQSPAVGGNTQVVLSWSSVIGAATYNIYRGTTSGGEVLVQTGVTALTYTDTGLTNGTTYYYEITAVFGAIKSPLSNEQNATPQTGVPGSLTLVDAIPGNTLVHLDWTQSNGATSYNLYRSTTPGTEVLVQSGITGLSYTDTGLTNGQIYYYKVAGVNGAGPGPLSNELSATPSLNLLPPVVNAPTVQNNQLTITWTAAVNATGYNIYRGTSSGGEGATPIASNVTGTTYIDTPLAGGTTYYYKLRSTSGANISALSNEVSGLPTLSAPSTLIDSAGNAQSTLSWSGVLGATSYNLYRGTVSGGETLYQTGLVSTTYVDTGETNGTTYYFQVTAVNANVAESGKSNEANATPSANAPAVPTNVVATGGPNMNSQWWDWPAPTALNSIGSYNAYRNTVNNPATATLIGSPPTTNWNGSQVPFTSFCDTPTVAGTTYYYWITSVFNAVESAKSAVASCTTIQPAPDNFRVYPGDGSVTLKWDNVAGNSNYDIYRGTTATSQTLLASNVAGTTYTDSTVTNGTVYWYYVVTRGISAPVNSKPSVLMPGKPVSWAASLLTDSNWAFAGAYLLPDKETTGFGWDSTLNNFRFSTPHGGYRPAMGSNGALGSLWLSGRAYSSPPTGFTNTSTLCEIQIPAANTWGTALGGPASCPIATYVQGWGDPSGGILGTTTKDDYGGVFSVESAARMMGNFFAYYTGTFTAPSTFTASLNIASPATLGPFSFLPFTVGQTGGTTQPAGWVAGPITDIPADWQIPLSPNPASPLTHICGQAGLSVGGRTGQGPLTALGFQFSAVPSDNVPHTDYVLYSVAHPIQGSGGVAVPSDMWGTFGWGADYGLGGMIFPEVSGKYALIANPSGGDGPEWYGFDQGIDEPNKTTNRVAYAAQGRAWQGFDLVKAGTKGSHAPNNNASFGYRTNLSFYDPHDLQAVKNGTLNLNAVVPYLTVNINKILPAAYQTGIWQAGLMALDRTNQYVHLVIKGGDHTRGQPLPIVVVFKLA